MQTKPDSLGQAWVSTCAFIWAFPKGHKNKARNPKTSQSCPFFLSFRCSNALCEFLASANSSVSLLIPHKAPNGILKDFFCCSGDHNPTSSQRQNFITQISLGKSNPIWNLYKKKSRKKKISGLIQTGCKTMSPMDTHYLLTGWLLVVCMGKHISRPASNHSLSSVVSDTRPFPPLWAPLTPYLQTFSTLQRTSA